MCRLIASAVHSDEEHVRPLADLVAEKTGGKHSHPGAEIAYVLEGTLEYQFENEPPVTLNAGQALFIPAGTIHAARTWERATRRNSRRISSRRATARGAGQVSRRSDGPLIAVPTITLTERNAHPASAVYAAKFSGKYVHAICLPYRAQLVARATQAFAAPSSTWTPFDRVVSHFLGCRHTDKWAADRPAPMWTSDRL